MTKTKKIILAVVAIVLLIAIVVAIIIAKKITNNNFDYEIEKITSWEYFNLYKDGKIGVINKQGDIIINPEYSSIEIPNPTKSVFICEDQDETVILNEKSEKILTNYDEVSDIKLNELAIEIPYEKSVLKYKENGKYGLINFEGKKITKANYSSLENLPYKEGEFLVEIDGKYGVINLLGKTVIDCKYDEIKIDNYYEDEGNYRNSGYIVGNKTDTETEYMYINYQGKEYNKEKYQELERIIDIQNKDEVYLIYKENDKYGILKNDITILKNEYDSIEYDDLNNIFITKKESKYGISDIEGNTVISNIYAQMEIEGEYIYAQKDKEEFIFDSKGNRKENIEFKSEYSVKDTEYKIVIDQENKYGVRNLENEELIPNDYYYLEHLKDDYFIASGQDGKNGIVNKQGVIVPLKYDIIQKLKDTDLLEIYISETDDMYIYNIDLERIAYMKSGKIQEMDQYIKLYSKNEIKYLALNGEEKTNKEVFPENNLYADVKNGKWGFIDKDGNIKVQYEYDEVTEFNEYGYAGIKKDNKWGSVNSDGNIIVEPIYTIAENSTDISFIGKFYKNVYGYKKFYYTDNII